MISRFLWRAFKARYRDERTQLLAIRAAVGAGDVVCDIGANKGSYLYWLSRWVGDGRVVAFEPQPKLAAYLRSVSGKLPRRNVVVEQKAVASAPAARELYLPEGSESPEASLYRRGSASGSAARIEIQAVALDDYFRELPERGKLSALKVDVEGAEMEVFKGGERLLSECRPLLVFECEQRHLSQGTVFDVFAFLERRGYRGRFIQGRRLRPISEFSLEAHQPQAGPRYWDAKGYCNNFVFQG